MISSIFAPNRNSSLNQKLLTLFIVGLFSLSAFSQTPQAFVLEPEFEVEIATESPWSYSFELSDRSLLHERLDGEKVSGFETLHLQLEQFTNYQLENGPELGLGVRYRFRELFDESKYDELRFTQQASYSYPVSLVQIAHRIRVEQRLRNVEVIHRFRYNLAASKALNDVFELEASTEALYSVSPQHKPALEHRFGLELSNSTFSNLSLSLGVELRLGDYNIDTTNEYFLVTGVSLKL